MKIVRCNNCGKLLHKTTRCYYCGSSTSFKEVSDPIIHENVRMQYVEIEKLLENKKFSDVIKLSYEIIEWMPHFSSIFWIRLLAKNQCCNDEELIKNGFSYEDDPDFYNALIFSDAEEKQIYLDVSSKIEIIKKELKNKVVIHEYNAKNATNIVEIQLRMQSYVEEKRKKLFHLWTELKQIEDDLYDLEMKCKLMVAEHESILEEVYKEAISIKNIVDKFKECSSEDQYIYRIKLTSMMKLSEQEKQIFNKLKQHTYVSEFKKLLLKREQKATQIGIELSELKNYKKEVQSIISQIEKIEIQHKKALEKIEKNNFQSAKEILKNNDFNQIFQAAGVV